MDTIKILRSFSINHLPSEHEFTFNRGEVYTIDYVEGDEVTILIDDPEDIWEGRVSIPAAFEDYFEYVEADEDF
ncbi:hypothetical protein [Bacillus sp. UMB0728]|uniref:hypothetical protein n=1 Tax=Bacillus sp. UMB0728 TaxID=2066052 RepID=UPI000C78C86A|nr:hypothetical protein [Bacillus sp. UMB0728]PLR73510.1 hypothetical protein CYJ37_08185 [Bacillus sp. UMB0728]